MKCNKIIAPHRLHLTALVLLGIATFNAVAEQPAPPDAATQSEVKPQETTLDLAIGQFTPKEQTPVGAKKLQQDQDNVVSDANDLVALIQDPKPIAVARQIIQLMTDTSTKLSQDDTGGETIANETAVIESLYDLAKSLMQEPQEGEGGNPQKKKGQAMLDIMRRMMNMQGEGEEEGETGGNSEQESDNPGNNPGKGNAAPPPENVANAQGVSDPNAPTEARTVPRASGINISEVPAEFRGTLDAYNKTLQK